MQQYHLHTRQRGAIGIFGAVTLIIIVAMLALVIDSSRLYLERRNLQRVADLAALEAASRGGICAVQGQMTQSLADQAARQSAVRNGFSPGVGSRTLSARVGIIGQQPDGRRHLVSAQAGKPIDGVEVNVSRQVPSSIVANLASLFPGSGYSSTTTIGASATAQRLAQASLSVGSGLLSLVSGNSPLLNPLLNGLLDGDVDLKVLTPQGIAAANLELLSFLELLRARANAGSIEEILKTDIGVLPFISVLGELINQKAAVNTKLNNARLLTAGAVGVTVGQLLGLDAANSREALNTRVNLVELLTVAAVVANGKRSVDLDINLLALPNANTLIWNNRNQAGTIPGAGFVPPPPVTGLTKPLVGASLQVTELPQYAYGPPGRDSQNQWLTKAQTGQFALVLKLSDEPLGLLNIGGLIRVKLDMAVRIELAKGQAALKSISCASPAEVVIAANSAADAISITKANSSAPAEIAVTIAGINLLHLKLKTTANLLGDKSADLKFSYNPTTKSISPAMQKIATPINVQLPILQADLVTPTFETITECSVPLLGFLVCPIANVVVTIVNLTVASLINILGGVTQVANLILNALSKMLLQPLLDLLGIEIGYAQVKLHGVDHVPAQLVR